MPFRPEPEFHHGQPERTGVLLVNLGTPDAPTPEALRRYLAEFLSDRRVVEIPALIWKAILHGIILRTRPAKSAAKYASVWLPDGSPLLVWTRKQAALLQGFLGERGAQVLVQPAMRYGHPSIADGLNALRAQGATRILILPAYPQYSGATTASAFDGVALWAMQARRVPEFRFIHQYHDQPAHIEALAQGVRRHWAQHGRGGMLLMSFHGMPERTLHLGDPYHCHCLKTARLLAQTLGLSASEYRVSFQSRFGRAKWLEPSTESTLKDLAKQGVESLDVVCPGFLADCLETLEEIAQEGRQTFLAAGGKAFHYIPCLNDSTAGVAALAALCLQHLQGWPIQTPVGAELEATRLAALDKGARQ